MVAFFAVPCVDPGQEWSLNHFIVVTGVRGDHCPAECGRLGPWLPPEWNSSSQGTNSSLILSVLQPRSLFQPC